MLIDRNVKLAAEAGVFGAPSFIVDGTLFFGNDRLNFSKRRLRHERLSKRRGRLL